MYKDEKMYLFLISTDFNHPLMKSRCRWLGYGHLEWRKVMGPTRIMGHYDFRMYFAAQHI